jgi:L-rhamnose mutarotase
MTISAQDTTDFEIALKEYKKKHGRMFPTCSEILEVARAIGYNKPIDEESELTYSDDLEEEDEFGEFASEENFE